MANLSINFAGIKAPNPFWLASGPPSNSAYQVMKAFDYGWGGAVWKTIGASVVNVSSRYSGVNWGKKRLVGLSNIELISDRSVSANLHEMEMVKKQFPYHPIIASVMVETREEWIRIIQDCQNAGVDGIELNLGCPHGMCERGMGSAVGQEPKLVELITRWATEEAKVPVIVKLTPNITDITEPARAAKRGGADALSLINTIKCITGVDLDTFVPYPIVDQKSTHGGYSGPAVKPIALNMVKNCALDPQVGIPISGIGGIETWRDAVEFILLGAGSVQLCTAVMHHGFGIIRQLTDGLHSYMEEKGFSNVDEMVGKALSNVTEWENLNLNYRVVATINKEKCTRCQLCYTACNEGAYQAISLSPDSTIPNIEANRCVGCNLCSLICPVDHCITMIPCAGDGSIETWKHKIES